MTTVDQYTSTIVEPIIATIQAGQTTSGIIDTFGTSIVQIELPAIFDGSSLTFETSSNGVSFQPYYNVNNQQVAITCTQARNYGIAAPDFFPVRYLKIISNSTESAERIIKLIPKSI